MMTVTQAAELRMKWKPRVDPLSCEHLNLELEWSDNGYLMGNYNGIVCGTAAAKKTNMIAFITRSRDRDIVVSMDCCVSESA